MHNSAFHLCRDIALEQKRNPRLFNGKYISITRQDDGTLRPNFKPMKVDKHFSVETYAFKVYLELHKALKGLIEK